MSDENLEKVRWGYERFAARDLEALLSLFDSEAETRDAGGLGISETAGGYRHGPQGFLLATKETLEVFDDYRVEPEELIDVGDTVVAQVRIVGRGKASGALLEESLVHAWTFRDGKVIRGEVYRTTEEAIAALEGD
jgi:ketosteroid isomerase-like protein